MPSSIRQNRFQSFTPLRNTQTSLRRLKTAFSPTRLSRDMSPSSASSDGTTSPLTHSRTASPESRGLSPRSYRSDSSSSTNSAASTLHSAILLRRKPSMLEVEMLEERKCFSMELGLLEPRPQVGFGGRVEVGIFQVLEGQC